MADYEEESEKEINFEITSKWNPLLISGAKHNILQNIKTALEKNAEITHKSENGWDALIWASALGHFPIVKYLVRNGSLSSYRYKSFRRKEKSKRPKVKLGILKENVEKTPLQKSTIGGFNEITAFLVKKGFDWRVLDEYNNNCLHLAASSNDLETVKVLLQTGVMVDFKNSRGHVAKDLTSDKRVKELLEKYVLTLRCKSLDRDFEDLEVKFLCCVCESFVSKDGSHFEWIFLDANKEEAEYPLTRCKECFELIIKKEHELKKLIHKQDFFELNEIILEIEKKNIKIDCRLQKKAMYERKKLKLQKEFLETLKKLENVENYKTIKKSVATIEGKLKKAESDKIFISIEVLNKIDKECRRLIAERNLRHYINMTDFQNFTKENHENLKSLLKESEETQVSPNFTEKAKIYLKKMERILTAKKILTNFENYRKIEYPPPPIYDKRGKRWIDAITKKPIDLKKPQILPLKPKKKKKKKKRKKKKGKKEEEEKKTIPEWAEDRKMLIESYKKLEELILDENLNFEAEFVERSKKEIKRMQKENKYRLRIELDLKIIAEFNAKKRKK